MKEIKFNSEARESLKNGIDKLANAVKITLGPMGRNVIIDKVSGSPVITKDGVSVAREIELQDEFENIGARVLKEVASKTNDTVGDGTTSATVLAQAIMNAGLDVIKDGNNAVEIKKGLDFGMLKTFEYLDAMTIKIDSDEKIKQIASISANNDIGIGELISKAFKSVSDNGLVTVVEGNSTETILEAVDGTQFNSGYLSPYFVTNYDKMSVEYNLPKVLLLNFKLTNFKTIYSISEEASNEDTPLVIIADDIEGEALNSLSVNANRGFIKVLGIKSPGFGGYKKEMMEDLAIVTNSAIFKNANDLDSVSIDDLNSIDKIITTDRSTLIINKLKDKTKLNKKIDELKILKSKSKIAFDRNKINERIANLSGGIATISVGATSELEMKELKDRYDDAISAVKSAIDGGVIAGGGVALFKISKLIEGMRGENDQQTIGIKILNNAMKAPLLQILTNAGKDLNTIGGNISNFDRTGYDAKGDKIVDMIEAGIIDPVNVTKTSLRNAVSVAGTLLTTGCVLAIK